MKQLIKISSFVMIITLCLGFISAPNRVSGQSGGEDPTAMVTPQAGGGVDPGLEVQSVAATGPTGTIIPATWRNMRPTESFLRDVSMLPASVADNLNCNNATNDQRSKGWIVGDDGVILSYCNGIWDQSITVESLPTNLYGVAAVTPTLAFATGVNGTILKYGWDNSANDYTWVKFPIQLSNQILYRISITQDGDAGGFPKYVAWAVGGKDPTYGKATLVHGSIYSIDTDPNGHPVYTADWRNVTGDYSNLPVVDKYFGIQSIDANNVWAVGGSAALGIAIHWDGTTWTSYPIGSKAFNGIHFRSANDGWAVGDGGQIAYYNGSKWSPVTSPVTTALIDVSFSPEGIGWATGYNGVLLRYFSGAWSIFNDLRTDFWDYYALDFNSGHGWMIGQNPYKKPAIKITSSSSVGIGGQILEFTDLDRAWVAVTIPTDNQLNDVITLSDTNAWAVGAADANGATVIHWDGRHWQRWYQLDAPLPVADLQTIDMISPSEGWAAGSPPKAEAPALMLRWNGIRWSIPRYNAPINVKINSLRLINVEDGGPKTYGWAVADSGNAVAKKDYTSGLSDYWTANHTFGGIYYTLRGLSLNCFDKSCSPTEISAWAVGQNVSVSPALEYFLRYVNFGGTWYWDKVSSPPLCPDPPNGKPGAEAADLWGIRVMQNANKSEWGFASGNYNDRSTIYQYNGATWSVVYCNPVNTGSYHRDPSRFYATDIVPDSGIGWFGGYYTVQVVINGKITDMKIADIAYQDAVTFNHNLAVFPVNGRNIYDRPITSLDMSSSTMGWAVGEKEDTAKVGVLYQYPYPNFTLMATPSVQANRPATQAVYTISASGIAAGNMTITLNLDLSQLPAGITGSFDSNTIDPTHPTVLRLNIPANYPMGKYADKIGVTGNATIHSGDLDIPVVRTTSLTLWVTDHPLTSVSPDHGPAGTVVTITGESMGTDPGTGNRSTTANHVMLAGAQLPNSSILSWSPTQIVVRVPDDVNVYPNGPVQDIVQVFSGGTPSSDNLVFKLESTLASADLILTDTMKVITLNGTSFGEDPANLGTNSLRSTDLEHITLDGVMIDYWNVISWSNNQIVFQVPKATKTIGKNVTLTVNGYVSNSVRLPGSVVNLPLIKFSK